MTYTYQVKALRGVVASEGSNQVSVTSPDLCSGSGFNSTPENVPVTATPIVVTSTSTDYFVLFVRPDLNLDHEIPISVTLGEDGETTLTEQLSALPVAHYRVEKYSVDDPGDVDGDCTHDIDELADVGTMNPVNPARSIDLINGTTAIPDRATFEHLSYQGRQVVIDDHLRDLEFVKFYLYDMDTDRPAVYFMNTVTHRAHHSFAFSVYVPQRGRMRGEIVYHPNVAAADGSLGVYRFEFEPGDSYAFEAVQYAYETLAASMPLLENNLAYYPMPLRALPLYNTEKTKYDASRVNILLEEDVLPDVDFISLNQGTGYGFLRVMERDERPSPRDIVIYESLPNDLSRVAGIITTVPQTPLSHVNLRAVQDSIPNAFVRDAIDDDTIDSLIDSHVQYTVTRTGYTIRAATKAEVDAHYEASRPATTQTPQRDLSVKEITALSDIGFDDWDAFGVKAANVAVLGTLGFSDGTVPDGFAVPFYFYDEFMKQTALGEETVLGKKSAPDEQKITLSAETTLAEAVSAMLAHAYFQTDYVIQEEMLDDLRDAIEDATSPQFIIDALTAMHATYPEGQSLRYRSSTNNEDLPGFSGAGLYDSKTQDPDETEEDGIDKSIKGVWASLWNVRAFVERDFHRIDHLATAMGVLVHPNYSDELANGVAVSYDPLGDRDDVYYINTQVGEDLVTNPEALSVPEEILLLSGGIYEVLVYSNQMEAEQLLMSDAQIEQLRSHLTTIHDRFKVLYDPAADEPFAMEIEFKITVDDVLAIKQARPWVFDGVEGFVTPPPPPPPPSTGGGGGFGPAPVAPKFVDGFRTTRAIAENARPGDAVGEAVSATHPDDLEITCFLSGADASLFTVDEETGQISVREGVELVFGTTYTVNLTATDSAGFGALVIVVIEVTEASFSPYDLNGNDAIERDEVIMAIKDYFSGETTKNDVIELIKLYFAGPG